MSVNQYINGKLNLIAGGFSGSGGGGECGCEENTFTGTMEEVQAAIAAGEIKDDFIIFVTDDFEEISSDNKIEYVTQEEYDALPESKLTDNVEYRITDKGIDSVSASNVKYDNAVSGLEAVNVQGAVDELKEDVDGLQGDISTLNDSLEDKIIRVTVTNVTTDNYGFFDIKSKLKTYTDNGYKIVNAYGKNNSLSQYGTPLYVNFSTATYNCELESYGYLYKASGSTIEPLAGGINVTLLVIMMK